jgi:hypothetical protein
MRYGPSATGGVVPPIVLVLVLVLVIDLACGQAYPVASFVYVSFSVRAPLTNDDQKSRTRTTTIGGGKTEAENVRIMNVL